MSDELNDYRRRYEAALHAMQTGVRMEIELSLSGAHTPKHLRVGVNSAMIEHAALVRLLVDKGVLTWLEYYRALAEGMEAERQIYEERLSASLQRPVKLV